MMVNKQGGTTMTRYIKFENNTAIEAPSTIVKGGKQILGYLMHSLGCSGTEATIILL